MVSFGIPTPKGFGCVKGTEPAADTGPDRPLPERVPSTRGWSRDRRFARFAGSPTAIGPRVAPNCDVEILDQTYPTPAENLACDEAILDWIDGEPPLDGRSGGMLRFFESPVPFVVVGYGNRTASEVNLAACQDAGIAVFRRVSGGGTVVLGPGCLAYAVALPVNVSPELGSVTGANRWIMERQRQAAQAVIGREVRVQGHTDLTVDGWKFSGNAQRRRARSVLFHGTLLLNFDLGMISRLLRFPSAEPDYRAGREHSEFVTNLRVPTDLMKQALAEAWGAVTPCQADLGGRIRELVDARYGRSEWNYRR